MTAASVPVAIESEVNECTLPFYSAEGDTESLKREALQLIGQVERNLARLARIWQVLHERGESLDSLEVIRKSGLLPFLSLIASGAVVPEVVVAFAGRVTLLRAVCVLPLDRQRALASGERIKVAVRHGNEWTHRLVPPELLTTAQIRQVFDKEGRREREVAEQINVLSAAPPAWNPGRPVKRGRVVIDRTAQTVAIGSTVAPLADVLDALRASGVSL